MLDANALIDFLGDRPGRPNEASICRCRARPESAPDVCHQLGEGLYHLWERYGEDSARQTISGMERLPIELVDVDLPLVMQAAGIKAHHKIPYVDCIAGVLALTRKAVLVTSDRDF